MDDGNHPLAFDPGAPPLREASARKKAKESNKRRFSDDQIRSLESMFEEEAKLEPGKKMRLAMDLGLQPRQVAIWFQNRRARWKTKQLEREYNALKADCDALSASVESLKKEKQSLLKQVQRLKEQLGEAESRPMSEECEEKPKMLVKEGADQLGMLECLDWEKVISSSVERLGPEESDLMNFTEPVDGRSITWPEEWGDLDSGSFCDQSCTTMECWDVWA